MLPTNLDPRCHPKCISKEIVSTARLPAPKTLAESLQALSVLQANNRTMSAKRASGVHDDSLPVSRPPQPAHLQPPHLLHLPGAPSTCGTCNLTLLCTLETCSLRGHGTHRGRLAGLTCHAKPVRMLIVLALTNRA